MINQTCKNCGTGRQGLISCACGLNQFPDLKKNKNTPDISPQAVERLSPYAIDGGCDAYGDMENDPHGDYVRYEDYAALRALVQGKNNEDT